MLRAILQRSALPLELFLDDARAANAAPRARHRRVHDVGPEGAPVVLLHHLKHNKVLHEQVVLLSVAAGRRARGGRRRARAASKQLGHGFFRVIARYGFMETPNVPADPRACRAQRASTPEPIETSYYLGRERLLPIGHGEDDALAEEAVRRSCRATRGRRREFFGIPPNRVVELGRADRAVTGLSFS